MSVRTGQQGMTLVEMLVSLAAGLLMMAGALSLFASVMVAGNTTLMLSRLNQDVQAVTDLMVRDIQRAGYHPQAGQGIQSPTVTALMFSISDDLHAVHGAVPDCIRIKYMNDDDKPVLRVYSHDKNSNRLEVKEDAPSDKPLSDLCGTGSALMAEQEISIDDVRFELVPGSSAAGMRSIRLTLSASHISRPALAVSLQQEVKLRNDGY